MGVHSGRHFSGLLLDMTEGRAVVKLFHDIISHTGQYVVSCAATKQCAIIDAVAEYDPVTGIISTSEVDKIEAYVKENPLSVKWILETHAHADHVSGAPIVQSRLGGKIAIGSRISEVQNIMGKAFNLSDINKDSSHFDQLWNDGDEFNIGEISVKVFHTPGHTPACICYYIPNDAIFVGDTIFMPDMGTARCDFPGGSSKQIWNSIQKILALPPATRLFTCHDY